MAAAGLPDHARKLHRRYTDWWLLDGEFELDLAMTATMADAPTRDITRVSRAPTDAPCFVFHAANAYDDADGRVILDVIAYEMVFVSVGGGLDTPGRLERWMIDPSTKRIERRVIDPAAQEFPRIDARLFGHRHRYVYTVSVPTDGNTQLAGATQLYKNDLATGGRRVQAFGANRVLGEFVFVPARTGAGEDEGWLVRVGHRHRNRHDRLRRPRRAIVRGPPSPGYASSTGSRRASMATGSRPTCRPEWPSVVPERGRRRT